MLSDVVLRRVRSAAGHQVMIAYIIEGLKRSAQFPCIGVAGQPAGAGRPLGHGALRPGRCQGCQSPGGFGWLREVQLLQICGGAQYLGCREGPPGEASTDAQQACALHDVLQSACIAVIISASVKCHKSMSAVS